MEETNKYPVFKPNQVLNHNHLNTLRNYLDFQDRSTRIRLIGTGIVCGLEVKWDSTGTVTITSGCGISSEGYLLYLFPENDLSFTHFKSFTPSDEYDAFYTRDSSGDKTNTLYDLFELTNSTSDTSLSDVSFTPGNMAVILYLDYTEEEIDTCSNVNCDERGTWKEFDIKVLLIDKSDLAQLIKYINQEYKDDTSIVNEDDLKNEIYEKYDLSFLKVKRPYETTEGNILELDDSVTYDELEALYINAIKYSLFGPSAATGSSIIESSINEAYLLYEPLLSDTVTTTEKENAFTTLKSTIDDLSLNDAPGSRTPVEGIQYYYGYFKDLTDAYNEFVSEAFQLMASCCCDTDEFPRHLMLGEIIPDEDYKPSIYRRFFKQPPVYNGNAKRLEEVKRLFKRIILLIENFAIPDGEDLLENLEEGVSPVKITPCKGYEKEKMGERSIPYYYDLENTSSSLHRYWNYEKYNMCRAEINLSYNAFEYSTNEFITKPLEFNIDKYPFFRIEGHLGMDINDVLNSLFNDIQKYNLPINIIPLYIGNISSSENKVDFSDLQTLYSEWRNKVIYFKSKIFSLTGFVDKLTNADENEKAILLGELTGELYRASKKGDTKEKKAVVSESKKRGTFETFDTIMGSYSSKININDIRSKEKIASEEFKITESESLDNFIYKTIDEFNDALLDLLSSLTVSLENFKYTSYIDNYKTIIDICINLLNNYFKEFSEDEIDDFEGFFKGLGVLVIVHNIISSIGTYLNITIWNIVDSYQYRQQSKLSFFNLTEFQKSHPGIEHLAGVNKGGTFALVYDPDEEGLKIENGVSEEANLPEDLFVNDTGKVVADFCIPSAYFQDTNVIPAIKSLTPVAFQHLRIVGVDIENNYKQQEIQLLEDMYDPTEFEWKITKEPILGKLGSVEKSYDLDSTGKKKIKILTYDVDISAIKDESSIPRKAIVYKGKKISIYKDILEYNILDTNNNGKVVDKEEISIFIIKIKEELVTNGTVSGKVVDLENSSPLENVRVSVKEDTSIYAITDSSGFYELDIEEGTYTLTASLTGYISSEKTVSIVEGETIEINFDLAVSQTGDIKLEGTVLLTYNQDISSRTAKAGAYSPIPNTLVSILDRQGNVTGSSKTDNDGKYSLSVKAGKYKLQVNYASILLNEENITLIEDVTGHNILIDYQDLEISVVTGTVREIKTGDAIAKATVSVEKKANISVKTDEEGNYVLPAPLKTLNIRAGKENYDSETKSITVKKEKNILNFDLTFTAGKLNNVIITVIDKANKEPVADVEVSIPGTNYKEKTDSNGNVVLDVPEGEYTFNAGKAGYSISSQKLKVIKGDNTLRFEIGTSKTSKVEFSELYEALGVEASSAKAKEIAESYSYRMEKYKEEINVIIEDDNISPGSSVSKVSTMIKALSEESTINIVKLNNDYNKLRNELNNEIEESTSRERKLYVEALKLLTFAYLERVAVEQPSKFSNTTIETIKETFSLFKGSKDINMSNEIESWASEVQGNVPSDFINNVKRVI